MKAEIEERSRRKKSLTLVEAIELLAVDPARAVLVHHPHQLSRLRVEQPFVVLALLSLGLLVVAVPDQFHQLLQVEEVVVVGVETAESTVDDLPHLFLIVGLHFDFVGQVALLSLPYFVLAKFF